MVRTCQPFYSVSAALEPRATITFVIANKSERPIYVPPSGSGLLELERRVGDKWETTVRRIRTLELRPAIAVLPGATMQDTAVLNLRSGVSPPLSPNEIQGSYRAVYAVFAEPDSGEVTGPSGKLLPKEERTSNAFRLLFTNGSRE